jgi:succinate dehydrogenase/fumarate reductase cytochrome b subunit
MRETAGWIWFFIAGIVIFILGGLHMTTVHLNAIFGIFNPAAGDAVAWENVSWRSGNFFFIVTYIFLLAAVLYHGFYGLRTIIFELGPSRRGQRLITNFLWCAGIVLFVVGTYAAIVARSLGKTL